MCDSKKKKQKCKKKKGIKRTLLWIGISAYQAYKPSGVSEELKNIKNKIRHGLIPEEIDKLERNEEIPQQGVDPKALLRQMQEWSNFEMAKWDGNKKIVSGAVYHGGKDLQQCMNEAYGLFSLSNPLHPDLFPYVRKMEAEIIAMSVSYFHGDPRQQCGL
ncbi:sphingosine phosphate lyase, partial [Reticulomyxa filosa]